MRRPSLNEALLAQRLAEIRQARDLLLPFAQRTPEEFTADRDAVDAAKYRLLMGIEACAQVCSHIISRVTGQSPDSIPHCFENLAEIGVIPHELALRLVQMARFRNILVHRYQIVDDLRVYHLLHEGLADWEAFIRSVSAYMQGEPDATTPE